jgi:hypothetical protein
MQKTLTLSFHRNAPEFSEARRGPQNSVQKESKLFCQVTQILYPRFNQCSVSGKARLQAEGMRVLAQVGLLYREKLVKYACGSSNCHVIPPCLLLIARDCLSKVIAPFCHLFMRLAQFDSYDSSIFHTNGSPRSLPS